MILEPPINLLTTFRDGIVAEDVSAPFTWAFDEGDIGIVATGEEPSAPTTPWDQTGQINAAGSDFEDFFSTVMVGDSIFVYGGDSNFAILEATAIVTPGDFTYVITLDIAVGTIGDGATAYKIADTVGILEAIEDEMGYRPIITTQTITFIPDTEIVDGTLADINLTRSGTGESITFQTELMNDREYTTATMNFEAKEGFNYEVEVVLNDVIIYTDFLFVTDQDPEEYQTITDAVENTTSNQFNFPNDE